MLKIKSSGKPKNQQTARRRLLIIIILVIIILLLLLGVGVALAQKLGWLDVILSADQRAHGTSQVDESATASTKQGSTKSGGSNTKSTTELKKLLEESGSDPDATESSDYDPADVAVEEYFYVDEEIAFAESTTSEVNLPRGYQQTAQAGQVGVKRVTYLAKYNSSGRSLAVEKVGEVMVSQPVAQITKVGVSDYNLNDGLAINYVESYICSVADLGSAGCLDTGTSKQPAEGFELAGTSYLYAVFRPDGTFSPAVNVSSNYFTFNGTTYYYNARFYTGATEVLGEQTCVQYGLACGRW